MKTSIITFNCWANYYVGVLISIKLIYIYLYILKIKCCAPKCNYNYASEKQNKDANEEKKKLPMFKFPDDDKYPEKRSMWIRKVPREDWKPNEKSLIWICELHFEDSDIIRLSNDANQRRKWKNYDTIALIC